MWRFRGMSVFCLAIVTAALCGSWAESKKDAGPAGPIPVQLTTAKKVFISYLESDADPGAPNLTYNEFYALVKAWGKYELVTSPADADLVFEIRYLSGLSDSQLRLSIVDAKTHFVLWPFIQHVQSSSRETSRRKNFDGAMSDLVEEVKRVTAP
jgi:hypothetical protein